MSSIEDRFFQSNENQKNNKEIDEVSARKKDILKEKEEIIDTDKVFISKRQKQPINNSLILYILISIIILAIAFWGFYFYKSNNSTEILNNSSNKENSSDKSNNSIDTQKSSDSWESLWELKTEKYNVVFVNNKWENIKITNDWNYSIWDDLGKTVCSNFDNAGITKAIAYVIMGNYKTFWLYWGSAWICNTDAGWEDIFFYDFSTQKKVSLLEEFKNKIKLNDYYWIYLNVRNIDNINIHYKDWRLYYEWEYSKKIADWLGNPISLDDNALSNKNIEIIKKEDLINNQPWIFRFYYDYLITNPENQDISEKSDNRINSQDEDKLAEEFLRSHYSDIANDNFWKAYNNYTRNLINDKIVKNPKTILRSLSSFSYDYKDVSNIEIDNFTKWPKDLNYKYIVSIYYNNWIKRKFLTESQLTRDNNQFKIDWYGWSEIK
ncbi:MAG: hypothetical protein ACD_49C00064G0026 [uncultured bacterium (gcode 4)]|uniref:Uncharacterized protein n=1 Tax=uncultured bacterium (gcode 4) TaxID=1234023 RepID=K2BBJ6_9BACT|nr:MAG: hypothetical protein ACD_49C00064G0026 [uncultured bacterium (gcode 4)]